MSRFRKSFHYQHPIESVWAALTDRQALAEWLMPNDFEPVMGRRFRLQVDPMPGFSGINECEVIAVEPPHYLAYTWRVIPAKPRDDAPPTLTVHWRLEKEGNGTRLILEQEGLEQLNWWWRMSMRGGWRRRLQSHLPRVLDQMEDGRLRTTGFIRRDYGVKTVPGHFAK
jgi:uncharacterized protein YndB with AHSA1/START domain